MYTKLNILYKYEANTSITLNLFKLYLQIIANRTLQYRTQNVLHLKIALYCRIYFVSGSRNFGSIFRIFCCITEHYMVIHFMKLAIIIFSTRTERSCCVSIIQKAAIKFFGTRQQYYCTVKYNTEIQKQSLLRQYKMFFV